MGGCTSKDKTVVEGEGCVIFSYFDDDCCVWLVLDDDDDGSLCFCAEILSVCLCDITHGISRNTWLRWWCWQISARDSTKRNDETGCDWFISFEMGNRGLTSRFRRFTMFRRFRKPKETWSLVEPVFRLLPCKTDFKHLPVRWKTLSHNRWDFES